ncbi:uncharacterized protein LOC133035953 [Cannabis sativa]|uniref:uncharacterized protein LOC133035953 n=1 Tax=Cannabis sativa TaxID=3483 RepID=UPI0029CA22C1|nr:uncharacterized protein LOC133035953 [Cannabis sativa]
MNPIDIRQHPKRVERWQSYHYTEPYPTNKSRSYRDSENSTQSHRLRDYIDKTTLPRWMRESDKGPIPEYNLNISPVDVVAVMKGMGNQVKGSEVSGVTYSAAKRHAREIVGIEGRPKKQTAAYRGQTISFVDDEASHLLNLHHDALVISLFISNCFTKRILIDNGSSANILFLNALREMGIDEATIIRKSTVLVGFSGEQKHSVGEVILHVYAEGVNLQTKFLVVDSPSDYNAILGRLWIHSMKAVPSTYHQVIRFPTKWGVKEIWGAQKAARDCYQNSLKEKSATL